MNYQDTNPIISEDIMGIALAALDWPQLEQKVILITGGSGFLASYLVKSLLMANDFHGLGLQIICMARKLKSVNLRLAGFLEHPALRVILHDISEPLPSNLAASDVVIHSASQASPKYYGTDPVGTLMANTAGTMYLLNHARSHNSARFLFFSSGEVYGSPNDPGALIAESDYGYLDPMQVRSCYAESKRIGETMSAAWSHQFGLHTTVVRPFHTYGPGMALDDGRVFADFVSDVVHCRDIVLKSNGLARRSFCYITDATLGFLTVLLNGSSAEAYNVANPSAEISMRDLAHTLAGLYPERAIGVKFESMAVDNSYIKSPIHRVCPSIAKISQLGWEPCVNIKEGFARTIQSYM